jgi:hypothetical protein
MVMETKIAVVMYGTGQLSLVSECDVCGDGKSRSRLRSDDNASVNLVRTCYMSNFYLSVLMDLSLFQCVLASHAQEAFRHPRRHGSDTEA